MIKCCINAKDNKILRHMVSTLRMSIPAEFH